MAGKERLLQHDFAIRLEGVSERSEKKRLLRKPQRSSKNKSILTPSEQIRRGRYEQQQNDTDVYASLLQIQEQTLSLEGRSDTEDDEDTPYETLFDHLQDLIKAVECLRAIPRPMQEKLRILSLAQQFESKNINQLSSIDSWKYKFHKFRGRATHWLHSVATFFTPWQTLIARTEHSLGSGVASYFIFLRWLLGLNFLLFLLIVGFVIIPQALVGEGLQAPGELRQAEGTSSLSYLLDGKGYLMEYSLLFYGYYDNKTIEIDTDVGVYNLPLAFLLTTGAIFFISFILVSRRIFGKNTVVFTAQQSFPFSWLLLSSWDHNIGDYAAATHRRSTILDSLKKAVKGDEVSQQSRKGRLYLIRIMVNVFVVLLLATSVVAIYFTVSSSTCLLLATTGVDLTIYFKSGPSSFPQFFSVMRVPLVVSGLNLVLPAVFEFIAQQNWEQLHPRKRLLLTLARTYVLYLANFIVVVVTLLASIKSSSEVTDIDDISCCVDTVSDTFPELLDFHSCARLATGSVSEDQLDDVSNRCWNNITSRSDIVTSFPCLKMIGPEKEDVFRCWETVIGQELFQLLNIDILIEICVAVLIFEWGRALIVSTGGCRCCGKLATWMGYARFHTSENVLVLIYQQAIVWLGFFFCPFLLGIGLLGMLIVFFLRLFSTRVAIEPEQVFREIQHNTRRYYMLALLGMLLVDLLAVGYVIVEKTPSRECGPFRNLPAMADLLVQVIATWPSWVKTVVLFFKSVAVVCILILLLCLLGYYQWHNAKAYKEFQKDLIHQMTLLRSKLQAQENAVSTVPTLRSPTSLVSVATSNGQVNTMHLPRVLPSVSNLKGRNRRDQKKEPQVPYPRAVTAAQKPLEAMQMARQPNPKRRASNEAKRLAVKPKEEKKKKVPVQRPSSVVISGEVSEPAQEFEYFNSGFDALYAAADVSQQGQSQWPQANRAGLRNKNPKKGVPLPSIPQSFSHVQVPGFMLGTLDDPYQEDYNRPADYWITLPQDDT